MRQDPACPATLAARIAHVRIRDSPRATRACDILSGSAPPATGEIVDTRNVLDNTNQNLTALLDMMPTGVLFADTRGRITFGNPAACALLGFMKIEAQTSLHVGDIYHRTADARRVLKAAQDGGGLSATPVDVVLRSRAGELIPAKVHVRVLRDDVGNVTGTMGVLVDQRELGELGRRLEDAATQVISSERRAAVVDLAGRAAHDLSQPLMAAMGNIELILMQKNLDAKVSTRLERTYEQLERLGEIMAEFVKMTGTRSGA
ncbi:MAG: PAS domain-containing protein [Myxococcales bacterium]|nr:PAS domain-containing protein [Myxococcales bacterium]